MRRLIFLTLTLAMCFTSVSAEDIDVQDPKNQSASLMN